MRMEDSTKIVDMTEDELIEAGFLGLGAPEGVKRTVQLARENPKLLSKLTMCMVQCQKETEEHKPIPSARTDPSTRTSRITAEDIKVTAPHLTCRYERVNYYNGISSNPPELLYRSNLTSHPFPIPRPGTTGLRLPKKTADGVFNTPLNPVWHVVAPKIIALLKARGIKRFALKAARFFTTDDDGRKTRGPITIWIAVHPRTTSAAKARDITPDIIRLLQSHQVYGTVVEWYESVIRNLSGQAMMEVVSDTDPTHGIRHPFTTALGVPIVTQEMEKEDAMGTIAFYFHERIDKNGKKSERVLALTNCHVLSKNTDVDYAFDDSDATAPRRNVRVCGDRRFQRAVGGIREEITEKAIRYTRLAEAVARLNVKDASERLKDHDTALLIKMEELTKAEVAVEKLELYLDLVTTEWADIQDRDIGYIDWVPKISISEETVPYILDIGTFALDPSKFQENFMGNVVDLGKQYTSEQLTETFWQDSASRAGKSIPPDRLLRITSVVPHKLVVAPDSFDENGDPQYIVAKYGNSSDLTIGRYSGLEAYLCYDVGTTVKVVAVYNHDKSTDFSRPGDSGSLIFTGDGRMLAIVRSGEVKGFDTHVTYGIPVWKIMEVLKDQYPFADPWGKTFYQA